MGHYSHRAQEVARDLFSSLDAELGDRQHVRCNLKFHLDASEVVLSRAQAEEWVQQSVDDGFPEVRYYIERSEVSETVVNLAAFEDRDSQFPP